MGRRTVVAPFTLVLPRAERKFLPGEVVDGEMAAHWYVQHHSEEAPNESGEAETDAAAKPRKK